MGSANTLEITVEQKFEEAYEKIKTAFAKWVATLPYGNVEKRIRLKRSGSSFINFNYSLTLEKLYYIKDPQSLKD